jgi:hypothetical protein
MIRSVLASPWLPLLYWAGIVSALICEARHEPVKRQLGHQEFQTVVRTSALTTSLRRDDSSPFASHSGKRTIYQPTRVWSPQIFVLRSLDSSAYRPVTEIATNGKCNSGESPTTVHAPITMLSIRVDQPEQTLTKFLTIQCRSSAPITNAYGRTVTLRGVVTQEVVSSAGKILIMAGSRVVGSAVLDPENGRFKSDGLWSVIFDDTELKVQAELLDRPSGLPGVLGREASNEQAALQSEATMRDGRLIFIPKNAPFVLELHGQFVLRDLNSNSASN